MSKKWQYKPGLIYRITPMPEGVNRTFYKVWGMPVPKHGPRPAHMDLRGWLTFAIYENVSLYPCKMVTSEKDYERFRKHISVPRHYFMANGGVITTGSLVFLLEEIDAFPRFTAQFSSVGDGKNTPLVWCERGYHKVLFENQVLYIPRGAISKKPVRENQQ